MLIINQTSAKRATHPFTRTTQMITSIRLINPNPAAIAMMNFPKRTYDVVRSTPPMITDTPPVYAIANSIRRMKPMIGKYGANAGIALRKSQRNTILLIPPVKCEAVSRIPPIRQSSNGVWFFNTFPQIFIESCSY